ncbi:hypothetical protein LSAT2_028232 [Lamellibrachia satsuma]|nr:hypothetical protein LSAT2_028232 [Lamellibrachia satsuma]
MTPNPVGLYSGPLTKHWTPVIKGSKHVVRAIWPTKVEVEQQSSLVVNTFRCSDYVRFFEPSPDFRGNDSFVVNIPVVFRGKWRFRKETLECHCGVIFTPRNVNTGRRNNANPCMYWLRHAGLLRCSKVRDPTAVFAIPGR